MIVVPGPENGSSTISRRFEQSRSVGYELHRLHRRVHGEFVEAVLPQRIDAGIFPDVGAVAAVLPNRPVATRSCFIPTQGI